MTVSGQIKNKACIVISFDFELGWGAIENGLWKKREQNDVYVNLRKDLPALLAEMDALEIPATWATVGAMLDEKDKIKLDHLPVDAKDRIYQALLSSKQSTFFGRDLVEKIIKSNVPHVFGCHTYSHLRFNYPGVTEKYVREDLSKFRDMVTEEMGVIDRFVFPQNQEKYYDELVAAGFKVARGSEYKDFKGSRLKYLISTITSPPPTSVSTEVLPGIIRKTGSMFFNPGNARKYRLPLVYSRATRGLEYIVKNGGVLHIWNHPFNFSECPELLPSFVKFLRKVNDYRNKGMLEVDYL